MKYPFILFFFLFVSACAPADNTATSQQVAVERISPEAFLAQYEPEAVVLDVRTPEEFNGGHLASAVNIDFRAADFRDQVSGLDRDKTYYLYCRSGNRSGQASEIMRDMGFKNLYNIGGLADLQAAGAE